MSRITQVALLIPCVLAISSVSAQSIYANNTIASNPENSDELLRFDPSSPSDYTVVGSFGVSGISFGGLGFNAQGDLYGYAALFKVTGGSATGLYSIDTDTGAATLIGDSGQAIQDIAYDPMTQTMYGVNTRFGSESTLFEIDLETGATASLGVLSGLPTQHHLAGVAINAQGEFIIHDILTDSLYKGDGASFTLLYSLTQDTAFSQGMVIDWSRDNKGYHAAIGFGIFPNYFSLVNTFESDGSDYSIGMAFGPNDNDGIPPVQPGDLAISPRVCSADLSDDGTLDFFDFSAFLNAFTSGSSEADFNDDGTLNFFDVSLFLGAFSEGCP